MLSLSATLTSQKKISAKQLILLIVPAFDAEELKILAQKIKKEYLEKSYCSTTVDTKLDIDDDGKALATFIITEGRKSIVKRDSFQRQLCNSKQRTAWHHDNP